MRIKIGGDLYHKTLEDFKNIDGQILKAREIMTCCKENYHSFSTQVGNMKGCTGM